MSHITGRGALSPLCLVGIELADYKMDHRCDDPETWQEMRYSKLKCFSVIVCILLILGLLVVDSKAANVILSWDANTEADLAGYKVYFGTSSRNYGSPIAVGIQTTYTVQGLAPGTYFFGVKAYDTSGNESGFSNEFSANISQVPPGTGCDVNSDGSINVVDLQLVTNAILSGTNASNCDINRDGNVNALDVQVLSNVILGVGVCP